LFTFGWTTGSLCPSLSSLPAPRHSPCSYLRHANDDRYEIVRVYVTGLYATLLLLLLSLTAHLSRRIAKIFTPHKLFTNSCSRCRGFLHPADDSAPPAIEFRDIEGAAYIPQHHPRYLLNPIFGCDMAELPIQFSPLASNSYGEYTADPRVCLLSFRLILPSSLALTSPPPPQDFSIYRPEFFKYLPPEGLKVSPYPLSLPRQHLTFASAALEIIQLCDFL
jgi:hypothetical protein